MLKQIKYTFIIAVLAATSIVAQERTRDTLDTEVVSVIKPYTPTVSDAFKIKENPTLDDETTTTKKVVNYNIFSIPVASTFTPAKGRAAAVSRAKPEKLYDNYASLGVGSYTTVLAEVYLNHELDQGQHIGGNLTHHSSSGGISGLLLDDDFINTKLNVNYGQRARNMSWALDAGGLYQKYNWYGLPQSYFDATTAALISEGHQFYGGNVGAKIQLDDFLINDASVRYRRFGDNQGSGENRFVIKTSADIPIQNEVISTALTIDYIKGAFDRHYETDTKLKYGNVSFGLAPSYRMIHDDLTLNLGVNFVYKNDTEDGVSNLYIYPNITASLRIIDELMILFGGIEGGLQQHSYYDFAQDNPFVSPTLDITPTDKQYDASVGLMGKLSNSMSYNVSAHYINETNKALFRANPVYVGATENYQYGNSFGVVYDDIKTVSFKGEINVDVNRGFTLGVKGELFSYNTHYESKAWNLPELQASLFMDYQIDKNWYTGAQLYYVGERKDRFFETGNLNIGGTTIDQIITLDSYFDANAYVGYRFYDQLSFFAKVNNIANQDYKRWLNTPVQGIQFLVGVSYQFDF